MSTESLPAKSHDQLDVELQQRLIECAALARQIERSLREPSCPGEERDAREMASLLARELGALEEVAA